MGYGRYRRTRRTSRRRRYSRRQAVPWYRRRYSPAEMASKALRGLSYVKGMLNTERKYLDTTGSTYSCDTTPSVIHLTNIVSGDTQSQRDGRQVKLTKLSGRINIACSSVNGQDNVRVMIIRMKTNAAPGVTDVLDTATVQSFRNLNNVRFMDVVYDKLYNLDTDNKGQLLVTINKYLQTKVQWTAGANTVQYGHYYMFILGTWATASNPSTANYSFRVRYVDN